MRDLFSIVLTDERAKARVACTEAVHIVKAHDFPMTLAMPVLPTFGFVLLMVG